MKWNVLIHKKNWGMNMAKKKKSGTKKGGSPTETGKKTKKSGKKKK